MAVIADGFNGVLDALVNGRVAGGTAWSCNGALGADASGLKINAANQAKNSSGNGCLGRIETGSADHYARVRSFGRSTTSLAAAVVRAIDYRNFIALRVISATQVELYKRVGSTSDQRIAVFTLATSAPVMLELRCEAGVLRPFVEGAQLGATGGYAIVDAVFDGVTRAGLWARGALDPCADDFEAGSFGAPAGSLSPANARSILRGRAPVIAWRGVLLPARGRSATRDRAPVLRVAVGAIAPVRGRSVLRGGEARLTVVGAIAPARARLPLRGSAAVVSVGGGGGTPVAADDRVAAAAREMRVVAVLRD